MRILWLLRPWWVIALAGAVGLAPAASIAAPVGPAPTPRPVDPSAALLDQTGAATCKVAAVTATTNQGFFVVGGLKNTQEAEKAFTSDRKWEVRLAQGTDVGIKAGLKVPSLDDADGSAMFAATLGYQSASTYETTDNAEADRIVAFGRDPLNHRDPGTLAVLRSRIRSTYTGGDASLDLSVDAFAEAAGGSLGARVALGTEHFANGVADSISTVAVHAENNTALFGLPDADADVALTQEALSAADGQRPVGITVRVTSNDVGSSSADVPLKLPTASKGPVERTVGQFTLGIGADANGELGETVATAAFSSAADAQRVQADLSGEARWASDPIGAVAALVDLLGFVDQQGLITYRRYHVVSVGNGLSLSAGEGIVVSIDFAGEDKTTTLVRADQVLPDGSMKPWAPCQEATVVHIRVLSGILPGIGATMGAWTSGHQADLTDTGFPMLIAPCPEKAPPNCSGNFPINYDAGGPQGDVFRVVEPAQGPDCPEPFLVEARTAEEQSCRVAQMLIELPHPVTEEAAVELARAQLPKDTETTEPAPGDIHGNLRCAKWHSATLAGLSTLRDPSGDVSVGFLSGKVDIESIFEALAGTGGEVAPYDPEDVVGITLVTSGRMQVC